MSVETYATLINRKLLVPSQKTNYVAVELRFFVEAMQNSIRRIYFDETWYIKSYPDIRTAISNKKFRNAHEHYIFHGFFEHRLPYEIRVEETWYLDQYEDIRLAVAGRDYESGQSHFEQVGYSEGRMPYANFSLKSVA